jgi:hypothetical protein
MIRSIRSPPGKSCSHNGLSHCMYRSPAKDVVNQDIEAAALVLDGCHQGGYLAGILVINHSRGARPAGRTDQITGLLDRLRPADLGRPRRPAAAARRIDKEPSTRQLDGNRPPRPG